MWVLRMQGLGRGEWRSRFRAYIVLGSKFRDICCLVSRLGPSFQRVIFKDREGGVRGLATR